MPTNQFKGQNNQTLRMQEQDLMEDLLTSQKKLTSDYNTFCSEIVDKNLKQDVLNLLRDEHEAESMIFEELQSRGWYTTKAASQQEIQSAQQKFSQIDQNLGL